MINDAPEAITPVAWPTGKPHISFSELSDWIQCPFRHKLIHIDKRGTFSTTPHIGLGQGVHDSNENYIKTRVMDKSIARSVIEKHWQDNEELFTKGPFPSWASGGFGTLADWLKKSDMILDDVPSALENEFPGWECHDAEEYLYESMDPHPIKFKGYIDSIIKVKSKNKLLYWIIDWKTCGWGWPREKQQDFNVHLQLILYKNFWAKKHGVDPKDVRCAFGLLKRDGKPGKSVSFIPISVGPVTSGRGLKVIDNHVRSVQKKLFIKNRNNCKFCEFENTELCPPNL